MGNIANYWSLHTVEASGSIPLRPTRFPKKRINF